MPYVAKKKPLVNSLIKLGHDIYQRFFLYSNFMHAFTNVLHKADREH